MSEGFRVIWPATVGTPLTYKTPVSPDRVTARLTHWPTGRGSVSRICSPVEPEVVIAKRMVLSADIGVRNMYEVVLLPKSKMRCHAPPPLHLIQAVMVMPVLLATPLGSWT